MIYNDKYEIVFYKDSFTGREPVLDYIKSLNKKTRNKINKYIDLLEKSNGYLNEPYSRHIIGKIRELRVDFDNSHHRIFYFSFVNKNIILLSAFMKRTNKTPPKEIVKAERNYQDVINNLQLYE